MIAWYIVHRDRRRRREDRAETPDVFLVSAADVVGVKKKKIKVGRGREGLERSGSGSSSLERINTHALHSLHDMHVGEAAVHHISEEDDCVRTLALRDAPRLAQIHVDEDPGDGPEERAALRVRPVIENLRIGDEEDVSCLSTSLDDRVGRSETSTTKGGGRKTTYSWVWPATACTCGEEYADFEPQDDCNPDYSYGPQ